MPSLKTLFVDHTAQLSGGELALLRSLSAAPRRDFKVLLLEAGPLEARLVAAGVEVLVASRGVAPQAGGLRGTSWRSLRLDLLGTLLRQARSIREFVRAERFDVVYANSARSMILSRLALFGLPAKLVWHVRDHLTKEYFSHLGLMVIRIAGRRVSLFVSNSSSTESTVRAVMGGGIDRRRSRCVVVPSPIDAPVKRGAEAGRAGGPLRVALIGRLCEWKGQLEFLRSLDAAGSAAASKFDILIAGSALFGEESYATDVNDIANSQALRGYVTMLGFVDDVMSLLSDCDVLIHTSLIPEPYGQVVAQGMAAGCCVVAANSGGPAEMIEDGVTGRLYPNGDFECLISILLDLDADRALTRLLGRASAGSFSRMDGASSFRAIEDVISLLNSADA